MRRRARHVRVRRHIDNVLCDGVVHLPGTVLRSHSRKSIRAVRLFCESVQLLDFRRTCGGLLLEGEADRIAPFRDLDQATFTKGAVTCMTCVVLEAS